MGQKFVVSIELHENRNPDISIDGDVDKDLWQEHLVTGIIEILSMLEQMYGTETTQAIYKRSSNH
jgi:hypothetical protein